MKNTCLLILIGLYSTLLQAQANMAILEYEGSKDLTRELTSTISNKIINSGIINVVERSKIKAIMTEFKLKDSGIIDLTNSPRMGKILGVKYLLMGEIISMSHSDKTFNGYDLNLKYTDYYMTVKTQIISVETAKIVFSTQQTAHLKKHSNEFSKNNYFALLDKIANKTVDELLLNKTLKNINANIQITNRYVDVLFTSNPPNADIEINGAIIGNTGNQVSVEEGPQPIRISMAGFETWEKIVMIKEGLTLKVTLEKKNAKEELSIQNKEAIK